MATIQIIDSGFETTENLGTAYTPTHLTATVQQIKDGTFRVNGGNAIELKVKTFRYGIGAILETNPVPTQNSTTVGKGAGENPNLTISGVLDRSLISDSTLIRMLKRLPQSNGYKKISYNGSVSIANWKNTFDALESSSGTGIINVRVRTFDLNITPTNVLIFTLICEETE